MSFKWLLQVIKEHIWVAVMMFCALIVAILLLTIGFWKTLLIVALISAGAFFGSRIDKYGFIWFKAAYIKLFKRK